MPPDSLSQTNAYTNKRLQILSDKRLHKQTLTDIELTEVNNQSRNSCEKKKKPYLKQHKLNITQRAQLT